ISVFATVFTASEGIAKPTPSFPPESLSICALTPITWPLMFSSGPPEFPWLIAASVWIEPEIENLFGAVIVRLTALTIPVVMLSGRPNGLPIAATSSPTWRLDELPNVSGWSSEESPETLITAMSVDGSVPTSVAFSTVPSWKRTLIDVAPATTCWFVTMSPLVSITKPEPSAWLPDPRPDEPDDVTLMSTTPGATFLYSCVSVVDVARVAAGWPGTEATTGFWPQLE